MDNMDIMDNMDEIRANGEGWSAEWSEDAPPAEPNTLQRWRLKLYGEVLSFSSIPNSSEGPSEGSVRQHAIHPS